MREGFVSNVTKTTPISYERQFSLFLQQTQMGQTLKYCNISTLWSGNFFTLFYNAINLFCIETFECLIKMLKSVALNLMKTNIQKKLGQKSNIIAAFFFLFQQPIRVSKCLLHPCPVLQQTISCILGGIMALETDHYHLRRHSLGSLRFLSLSYEPQLDIVTNTLCCCYQEISDNCLQMRMRLLTAITLVASGYIFANRFRSRQIRHKSSSFFDRRNS